MKKSIKLFSTLALTSLALVGMGAGTAKSVQKAQYQSSTYQNEQYANIESTVGTGDITTPEGVVLANETITIDFGGGRVYSGTYTLTASTWIADIDAVTTPYTYETDNLIQLDAQIEMEESYVYQVEDEEVILLTLGPELIVDGESLTTADSYQTQFVWVESQRSFFVDLNEASNSFLRNASESSVPNVDMNFVIEVVNDPTADYYSKQDYTSYPGGTGVDSIADADGNDFTSENTKTISSSTVFNPSDYTTTAQEPTYYTNTKVTTLDEYTGSGTTNPGADGKVDGVSFTFDLYLGSNYEYFQKFEYAYTPGVSAGDNLNGLFKWSGYVNVPYYENGEIVGVYVVDFEPSYNNGVTYTVNNPERDNSYEMSFSISFADEANYQVYYDAIGGELYLQFIWTKTDTITDVNEYFVKYDMTQGSTDLGTASDGNMENGEVNYQNSFFNIYFYSYAFLDGVQEVGAINTPSGGTEPLISGYRLITKRQLDSQTTPIYTSVQEDQIWWVLTIIWGSAFVALAGGMAWYFTAQAKENKQLAALEKEAKKAERALNKSKAKSKK